LAGSIEVSEEKGVRYLHFGSDFVQGAMRIARPWALELEYTRELLLPLILRDEPPSTVLQIGLGAGSITRYLHRWFPQARNTVVEIDPRVVTTAREFFKLPEESQHLRIVIGEGHDFVAGTKSRFDLVIATATTRGAAPARSTPWSSTRRRTRASRAGE
jgi:spermidine synthase